MSQPNKNNDKSRVTPIVIAIVTCLGAGCYTMLYWWIFQETVYEGRPVPVLLVFTILPIFVIVGVVLAVRQRMKEIDRGELDEAKKY